MASNCQTESCREYTNYNHSLSSDYQALPIPKHSSMKYGDGSFIRCSVSGSDRVSIGAILIQTPLCEASSVFGISHIQGIVGIGPPNHIGSKDTELNLMTALTRKKLLKHNLFAISYYTNYSNVIAGELRFGEIDSSKYIGNIEYYNISSQRDYWRLQLDNITDDKMTIPVNFSVVIDSGTTYALLPPELSLAINKFIGATIMVNGFYAIDCVEARRIPSLKFYLAGNPSPLVLEGMQFVRYIDGGNTHQSVCYSIFQESKIIINNRPVAIFGSLFIRNFLTVFSYDNASIGFGAPALALNGSSGCTPIILSLLTAFAIQLFY